MAGLFEAITLGQMTFKNRVVVSPMCQYSSDATGCVNDWHEVHYGSLSLGGAALVVIEATAVESRGRITAQDLGIYDGIHISGLRGLVDFAHKHGAKMGIQLAHAGRKADLEEDILAPSSIPFSHQYKVPNEATEQDLDDVVEAFGQATRRSVEAGFDCVEVHAAHGYLLHQFLSPFSNQRTDEYGGSLENRMRFPLRVIAAVRHEMPEDMPLFVRISGSEYSELGYTMEEMVAFSTKCKALHVDAIDVSSGGNLPIAPPHIYPGYQVGLAQAIKVGADLPVITVGLLDNPVLADHVIHAGQADMVAIARGFLRNPHWAHEAAVVLNQPVSPPVQYARAYPKS